MGSKVGHQHTELEHTFGTHLYQQAISRDSFHNFLPMSFFSQGTIGCTPNSVPMVFIVFSSKFLVIIIHKYPLYKAYIGISHSFNVGPGVHPIIP